MARSHLADDIVELRRRIARQPGTQAEHAARAGLARAGWQKFLRTYHIEEVLVAPTSPSRETVEARCALDLAVAMLLRDPETAQRASALHAEVSARFPVGLAELERLLAGEARAAGRVAEGEQVGTYRAACASCGRPY